MSFASEFLILLGILIVGGVITIVPLRMLFGQNLTLRLLLGLMTGIDILVVIVYFWARLGGVNNLKASLILVSIAMLPMLVNFFLVGKTLIDKLGRIGDELDASADQVADSASQVASAGNSLAVGASQQAASIEETSASLEELSVMTKQNAENTIEANRVMKEEAIPNFQQISDRMGKMKDAIGKTVSASEETAKIIKTIDEIAFQTNLLALNAAVEAARAGEAGAGFAVVADEVRNLAMRAAEAAKSTTDLIKDSNGRIKETSELNEQVFEVVEQNSNITNRVSTLIDEIARASAEQNSGIDQINQAMNHMDKVIQENAANSEESAASAEEMSAQAFKMKTLAGDLVTIVHGSTKKQPVKTKTYSDAHLPAGKRGNGTLQKVQPGKKGEVTPEQILSIEDDDF